MQRSTHSTPPINQRDRQATVQRVLVITLLLNLTVMGIKIVVGLATGSLSLAADGLHSLTDSANNVLGLVTMRYSNPAPDRDHPYGHQKFEAVGALGIAAFLGVACFEILQGAIERLIHGGTTKVGGTELWFLIVVLGVNIFVAIYERREGERVQSPLLIADAYHTMSDIWVTIAVMLGLIGVWALGWQWLDIVLAFPVAAMVMWSGWQVLRQNLPWLVDEMAIAPEAIRQVAMSVPGVIDAHDITSRGIVGRQAFIEMHLVLNVRELETAHQITEAIEGLLEKRYAPVRVMIHMEPPRYAEHLVK
jgi:cation diffusion facilitator family transporter